MTKGKKATLFAGVAFFLHIRALLQLYRSMKKTIFLGALLILLVSCVDSETAGAGSTQGSAISFSPYVGKTTRAGDITNTNFRNFAVYGGYDATAPVFNGDLVQKTENSWTPVEPRYWVYGKTYSFAAVSPADVRASFDLKELSIADYTPEDNDLVVAVTQAVETRQDTHPVSINFRHALSKVQISFKGVAGAKADVEISSLTLWDVYKKGDMTAVFDAGTEVGWTPAGATGSYSYTLTDNKGVKYMIPQSLTDKAGLSFHLRADLGDGDIVEGDYSVRIKTVEVGEWESGHSYNYIIDLDSTLHLQEIGFSVEEISEWEGEGLEADPTSPTVPEMRDPLADGKLCILAIGNSFSQDAVEQYLYELCEAAGIKAVIGNMFIGGCRLDTHWSNAQSESGAYAYRKVVDGVKTEYPNTSLPYGVADEDWDFITLQQASGSSGIYSTYDPYLQNLIDWISERSNAEILFHQTWAYAKNSDHTEFPKYSSDQMTMYQAIMETVSQAMTDHTQLKGVIPSGTAIQNGRTSFLKDSFNRDGYHLEITYGRYTAACTWFETLTGVNVIGNAYAPAGLNLQQKAIAQTAAHLAVQNPYEVTVLEEFARPAVTGFPTTPLYIDFGANKGDAIWNSIGETDASDVLLIDTEGNYTSAALTVESPFTSLFNGAGTEPAENNDITSGGITWPMKIWADSFVISGPTGADTGEAILAISGLDPSKAYDVTVISARWNGSRAARKTKFELISSGRVESTGISQGIGRPDFVWDAFDFDELSHTFENVLPADGVIKLKVVGLEVGSTVVEGNISGLCIAPSK